MTGHSADETADFLRQEGIHKLAGAVSTGSGQPVSLTGLPVLFEKGYVDIPGMRAPTVPGHQGVLRLVEGKDGLWAFWIGRRHFYEGFPHDEIARYVRVSRLLGAESLLCVNAAGGIDRSLEVGDLVLIKSFRNFIPIESEHNRVDFHTVWTASSGLRMRLLEASRACSVPLVEGTYIGVPGPTYETAAEVEWLRKLGVSVVGMSTTPELLAAASLSMQFVALSVVANVHGKTKELSHDHVVANSLAAGASLARLLEAFLRA